MKCYVYVLLIVMIFAVISSFGVDPNNFKVSDADVYFNFEGDWYGDGDMTSPCWQNKGTAATGEGPWMVGSKAGVDGPFPRVTDAAPDAGILGQALDMSHTTAGSTVNAYYWGAKGSTTTPLEEALSGCKSMTLTYWVYRIDTGDATNESILWSPQFYVYDLDHWAKIYIQSTSYYSPGAGKHDARDRWLFCAISIDTTTDTDNINIYTGTKDTPVSLVNTHSGSLTEINSGSDGFYFGLGSVHPANGGLALKGYLDEVRMYVDLEDGDAALNLEHVQDIFNSAFIETCDDVLAGGFQLKGDLNADCNIDLADVASLAGQWLTCNDPQEISCIQNW